jgi:hypothetical protein
VKIVGAQKSEQETVRWRATRKGNGRKKPFPSRRGCEEIYE